MLDTYQPSEEQRKQLEYLLNILIKSEQTDIRVWVLGGYGLDALYGKLTRDHNDFDLHIHEQHQEKFIQMIKSLNYYPTSEKVGKVGKEVYKQRDLSEKFRLELGVIEKGQELVRSLGFELKMPQKPLGILDGQPVWTPDLNGFKTVININNKLANKNMEYPHLEWQKAILKALEEKYPHKL